MNRFDYSDTYTLKRLVSFFLTVVLCCVLSPGHCAAAPLDLAGQISTNGTIVQESREILDVLYPGVKPSQEAKELVWNYLLAFKLSGVMDFLKKGQFDRGGQALADAVYGVDWKFSPLELFQALDGYKCSSVKLIPSDPSAKQDIGHLREAYRELRREEWDKIAPEGKVPGFSQLHSWASDGEVTLSSFIKARDNLSLSWNKLSRSSVATISALLNGAAEAEKGVASHYENVRANLTRHYLRHNLERWVVFDMLRQKTEELKKSFIAFLKDSQVSAPCRFLSIDDGKPVADVMVSFSGGLLGTTRTTEDGTSGVEMSLYRLGRLLNGDGWIPLSVYQERVEVLFTNLNLNSLLLSSKAVPLEGKTGVYYQNSARTFRVTTPGITLKVTTNAPGPEGYLGKVEKIEVSLSGQKTVTVEPGKTVEFKPLFGGTYLLSVAGKDSEDVIIKTAAKAITLASNLATVKTVSISLPSSEVEELFDTENIATLVKAFEANKDRLLANNLEVTEYRKAQGYLFKNNRKTLGKDIKEAMHSFQKISVGLKYKSVGLNVIKKIQALSRKLASLREDLPQKLTEGEDLRTNLVALIENYSSDNFDLDTSEEYLFLEKYKMNLEAAQLNHQELVVTLNRLLEETAPALEKYKKEVVDLMNEYTDKYQLNKFTIGLTNDSDFHSFIKKELHPLQRLVEKAKQLNLNKFLDDYNHQVAQLSRVVENRAGQLKVLMARLNERKTQLTEHGRLNLTPLQGQLDSLAESGFNILLLSKLSNVVPFSQADRGITKQQQRSFFGTLDTVSRLPELVITSREEAAAGYKGLVPASISRMLPALKLNGTISRNQAEGNRLEEQYKKLLYSSLVQVYDFQTPPAQIRELIGKEKHVRKKQINLAMGEVSSKWEAPDVLLKKVVKDGLAIDKAVKDLLGLYILEHGLRRTNDDKLVRLFNTDEFKKLEGTAVLSSSKNSDEGNENYRELITVLNKLKPILGEKKGKLLYPRLDDQMGENISHSISVVSNMVLGIVSGHYRQKAARLSALAVKLNPQNITEEIPEKEMVEAREIIDSLGNNKNIAALIKSAKAAGFAVGKSEEQCAKSAKQVKEYLDQLGG